VRICIHANKYIAQVAKEAKDEENLVKGRAFHEQFARIQVCVCLQ